jgi:hypothetical protein
MFATRRVVQKAAVMNSCIRSMATKAEKKGGKVSKPDDDIGGSIPGDVKKRIRTWLEKTLLSSPTIKPIPEAAAANEELFLEEIKQKQLIHAQKREKFEMAKIVLKERAVAAMPAALREEALKTDYNLWPGDHLRPQHNVPTKEWLLDRYRIVAIRSRW